MNKICTDIKQFKKLIELGIDVNTADMEYMFLKKDGSEVSNVPFVKDGFEERECCYIFIPCWSLAALLKIIKNRKDCNKVELLSNYASKWILTTTYYNSVWKEKEIVAEDPIDAAFQMVVWLKENSKI